MKRSTELRQQRAKLITDMRVILDGAGSDSLAPDKQRRFDALTVEVDGLAAQIETLEVQERHELGDSQATVRPVLRSGAGLAALEAELNSPGKPQISRDQMVADASAARRDEANYVVTTDGRQIRLLARGERLRDHARREFDGEYPSLGQVVRGLVTGKWDGVDKRAMGIGLDVTGGFLLPAPVAAEVIDLARAKARVFEAGARTIPMDTSELTIARITNDPTPYWRGEHVTITDSDLELGAVRLAPYTVAALVKLSFELAQDAANVNALVSATLTAALANEIDRVLLRGTGAGQPQGLKGMIGGQWNVPEQALGPNGATPTNYDNFSLAVQDVLAGNLEPNAVILHPRTLGTLDRLKDTTNQPLSPPESWGRLAKLATSQVSITETKGTSSDCSDGFVGQWDNLLVGVRQNILIEATREAGTSFEKAQVWVRALARVDSVLARSAAFSIVTGIRP